MRIEVPGATRDFTGGFRGTETVGEPLCMRNRKSTAKEDMTVRRLLVDQDMISSALDLQRTSDVRCRAGPESDGP